jgi:prepilin-type N-terminal cleavage/methylation domain-containing protein
VKINNNAVYGFTLVEIMVVVVIIGLLVAMGFPAYQKVHQSAMEKTVLNDGRQIGTAIQQYCMEYGVTQAPTFVYDTTSKTTGLFSNGTDPNLLTYLKGIGKNYSATSLTTPAADATSSFKLGLPGAFGGNTAVFNGSGKMMGTE